MRVLVTGGAGYVGASVVEALLRRRHRVRVLDALIHGQEAVAEELAAAGADLVRGDVRDARARARAVSNADAVVHLAAIVGDPACARDPQLSHSVNVVASRALIAIAREAGVRRFVFASTCSNYGRMDDPTVPIDECGALQPVSLYAEQKVAIERDLLAENGIPTPTCLRLATVYGVARRMRFDLTVNEFTRDLWAGRGLEVFGERFWRPYVHVEDVAAAVAAVLDAPEPVVRWQVFNVGRNDENYRKLDLVRAITDQVGDRGGVSFVHRDEDPRDYRVRFDKIRSVLGFEPRHRVADGIAELIAALDAERFGDPFDGRFANV